MRVLTGKGLTWGAIVVGALATGRSLNAQMLPVGTWVRQTTASMPAMTMVVEACCNGGRRLTYHVVIQKTETLLMVETRFDGAESPVLINGKSSGETMAIKRVDDFHATTVLKLNGTLFGTANGTLSKDGKTLTVEDDFSSGIGGNPVG